MVFWPIKLKNAFLTLGRGDNFYKSVSIGYFLFKNKNIFHRLSKQSLETDIMLHSSTVILAAIPFNCNDRSLHIVIFDGWHWPIQICYMYKDCLARSQAGLSLAYAFWTFWNHSLSLSLTQTEITVWVLSLSQQHECKGLDMMPIWETGLHMNKIKASLVLPLSLKQRQHSLISEMLINSILLIEDAVNNYSNGSSLWSFIRMFHWEKQCSFCCDISLQDNMITEQPT